MNVLQMFDRDMEITLTLTIFFYLFPNIVCDYFDKRFNERKKKITKLDKQEFCVSKFNVNGFVYFVIFFFSFRMVFYLFWLS